MRREKALVADGRTRAAVLRSLASTGRLEKSCLQGARYWRVPTLKRRRLARMYGGVNMCQWMRDVSEQKTGCMKKH